MLGVHHVPGVVIVHGDVLFEVRAEEHVVDGVLGCEVWGGEVVVAVGDEDFHVGELVHCFAEALGDVEVLVVGDSGEGPRPDIGEDFVAEVGLVVEVFSEVGVHAFGVDGLDRDIGRVVLVAFSGVVAVEGFES